MRLRHALAAALLLALPFVASADVTVSGGAAGGALPQVTVATLPTCNAGSQGQSRVVTDATSATSCTVGGGTDDNTCDCIDGTWTLRGASGTLGDADYGDFTVSGGNANIDSGAVGTAEIATDGVGAAEIVADGVGTSEIATDGVTAAELNATGVEAELEAVQDLQDFQGAVTDAQVPNTITIDNAAGLDVSGARLLYKAAGGGTAFEGDCYVEDIDDDGVVDDGEDCITHGDRIGTSVGGAPTGGSVFYYARNFDTSSSTTDGYQEAINHCAATMGNIGCTIAFGRGTFDLTTQVSYIVNEVRTNNIRVIGAGTNRGGGSATRIRIVANVTTANANCDGEEGETSGGPNTFTNEDIPVCAAILVMGWNHSFEYVEFTNDEFADVTMELAARTSAGSSPPADMDIPAVYSTSGTKFENVLFVDGDLAQVYVSARDNNSSSQSDHIDWNHVDFQAPNSTPKYSIYVDNQNSSQGNTCRNCLIRGYHVAGLNIRAGAFSLDSGSNEQADGTDDTYFARFCGDLLTDPDTSIVGTPACGDPVGVGNMKRMNINLWHHESEAGNGGFFWREGYTGGAGLHTEVSIRDTEVIVFGATAKVLHWDGAGALTIDHFTASNNHAGTNAIEIDCDSCSGADQDNQLNLVTDALSLEHTDIVMTVDMDGSDGIVWAGNRYFDAITQRVFFDTDGDRRPDSAERVAGTRTHATDCTAPTDGIAGDTCFEDDANDVYLCVPTAGDCSGAEWINLTP